MMNKVEIKKGDIVKVLYTCEADELYGVKRGNIYEAKRIREGYVLIHVCGLFYPLYNFQLEIHANNDSCSEDININSIEFENEQNEKNDIVNNPRHYKGNKGIETIDFIENVLTREEFIGYLRGNVIKYQSRANLKGRKEEDLKKAKWYSDKLVEVLKDEK
mgnify:FL=1